MSKYEFIDAVSFILFFSGIGLTVLAVIIGVINAAAQQK